MAAMQEGGETLTLQARRLLRHAKAATLATTDRNRPFTALVTPATAPDLSPILLLSALSAHTRHLRADPACALLVAGPAPEPNPQTAPRLALSCRAVPVPAAEDATLRRRYLAHHPYAAFYAGFGDFALWRLTIEAAHYVGGFASASPLDVAALCPGKTEVDTIAAVEEGVMLHGNAHHAEALDRIAAAAGETAGGWRIIAIDTDGLWLGRADSHADRGLRVDFPKSPDRHAGSFFAALRQELFARTHHAGG